MEQALFSSDDFPQLKAYELLTDIILNKDDSKPEFRRGNFRYIVHQENEMLLELHTQYVVGSSSFAIGPWGYVMLVHNSTGSLDQTILRAYYIIPPGDNLSEPTPLLIGKDFDNLDEAMDALEEELISASEDRENEDTFAGDIHNIGVAHAMPVV